MPLYSRLKTLRDREERLRTVEKLLLLRRQLDAQIPQKTASDTLLLATWNIREFGNNRRTESLHYIAEIISRFDVVAVQEVAANKEGLNKVMSFLDGNWDCFTSVSTSGTSGGGERMAFLYDKSKIVYDKELGDIVLPKKKLINGELQFARTPYCVSFMANWFKFKLITVHIHYGTPSETNPRRLAEINTIVDFLSKQAKKEDINYILLGDFNISNIGDVTMKALENKGFTVPDDIKNHPSDLGGTKHYDQIAFNLNQDVRMTLFSKDKQKSGAFNFTESIYTPEDMETYQQYFSEKNTKGKTAKEIETYYLSTWRTFQISDHLPLWVELKIDFSDQYLEKIRDKQ
ncbi:MAG: endonuclease/exonuclease/phosphatase family protein [Prevotellaceae bacterium]|jgi:exonuclease III|nr:endonuclease/exonuclease/phosphatase family protein [Prevotellaceae bacterium]